MNYYEHHIGDYSQSSAHLTFVEDAAYRRLIQKYYATEKALPKDLKVLQRLIMAKTEEEQNAVASILKEFFTLTAEGWKQARCEKEIARYKDKQNKAKRSAEMRWRPSSEPQTQAQTSPFSECERIAHQTPDTKHQTPDTKHQTPYSINHTTNKQQNNGSEGSELVPSPFTPFHALPPPVVLAKTANLSGHFATLINREIKNPISSEDWQIREMINLGVHETQVISAIAIAKETRKKDGIKTPINAGLVLAILKAGAPKTHQAPMQNDVWWKTREGIDAKGRELSITAAPGESYEAYKARIFMHLERASQARQANQANQGRSMANILSTAFKPLSQGLPHGN